MLRATLLRRLWLVDSRGNQLLASPNQTAMRYFFCFLYFLSLFSFFSLDFAETCMKQICSMMAGVVVELLVKPGDAVEDGMDVAILESMKMQLPVASTETGKVEEIKVTSGDFVNEGDLLMVLS